MKKTFYILLILLLTLSLMESCGYPAKVETQDPGTENNTSLTESVQAVLASTPEAYEGSAEDFMYSGGEGTYSSWWKKRREAIEVLDVYRDGLDAYQENILKEMLSGDENTVFSPLNIYLALAVLAETTEGETKEEILKTLHAYDEGALKTITQALWEANSSDNPALTCLLANSLWLADDRSYNEELLQQLATGWHVSSFRGSMGSEELNQALRDWTNANTKDLLKEAVEGMETKPDTIFDLVSTLYLKASWTDPFEEEMTEEEVFHGRTTETIVPMLKKSAFLDYYRGNHFGAVALGVSECGWTYLILPDEDADLREVIPEDDFYTLIRDGWEYENRETYLVNLALPKFTVTAKSNLKETMAALGIQRIFDPEQADFSPLTEDDAVLSKAEHAATLILDEDGITGAAYTEMAAAEGAAMLEPEPLDFILDRPFAFVITGRDGSILFAGTVTDLIV